MFITRWLKGFILGLIGSAIGLIVVLVFTTLFYGICIDLYPDFGLERSYLFAAVVCALIGAVMLKNAWQNLKIGHVMWQSMWYSGLLTFVTVYWIGEAIWPFYDQSEITANFWYVWSFHVTVMGVLAGTFSAIKKID